MGRGVGVQMPPGQFQIYPGRQMPNPGVNPGAQYMVRGGIIPGAFPMQPQAQIQMGTPQVPNPNQQQQLKQQAKKR
jgi:hypothetical protein